MDLRLLRLHLPAAGMDQQAPCREGVGALGYVGGACTGTGHGVQFESPSSAQEAGGEGIFPP